MAQARYPSLFQINTRVWLTELSRTLGRAATLDDIADAALDRLAEQGFDWVWFLSVWQTDRPGWALTLAAAKSWLGNSSRWSAASSVIPPGSRSKNSI